MNESKENEEAPQQELSGNMWGWKWSWISLGIIIVCFLISIFAKPTENVNVIEDKIIEKDSTKILE